MKGNAYRERFPERWRVVIRGARELLARGLLFFYTSAK
jgi:hypothetical protein